MTDVQSIEVPAARTTILWESDWFMPFNFAAYGLDINKIKWNIYTTF